MGTSLRELRKFPQEVREEIGYGLYLAQLGDKHQKARPLKGFGGSGVLEVISDHRGDTYRAVYTVRLARAVYVLHAFQKKSKKGIETSQRDLDMIRQRLRDAEEADGEMTSGGKHEKGR
jgi:phage-related protein